MHNKFILYYFINNSMKTVRLSLSISICVYICAYVGYLNINLTFTLFQVFLNFYCLFSKKNWPRIRYGKARLSFRLNELGLFHSVIDLFCLHFLKHTDPARITLDWLKFCEPWNRKKEKSHSVRRLLTLWSVQVESNEAIDILLHF